MGEPWGRELRWLCTRILALGILLALYESLDGGPLHRAICAATAFALDLLGHSAIPLVSEARSSVLLVDGALYRITRGCTYANLALTLAPFVWRVELDLRANALRLSLLCSAIFLLDIARLTFGVHVQMAGWSWAAAHDLPNRVLRWSLVASSVVFALRDDCRSAQRVDRDRARLGRPGPLFTRSRTP
jgi:hypothetical protein